MIAVRSGNNLRSFASMTRDLVWVDMLAKQRDTCITLKSWQDRAE